MEKHIKQIPRWLFLGAGMTLVALVGYLDFLTGDYSILIFYMIPVGIEAWYLGNREGICTSLASGAARLVSDYFSYSHTSLRYWNSIQDMLFLLMVALLIAKIRKLLVVDNQPS
jgi:hypothetical protein